MRMKMKVDTRWNPSFAYAIGLITSDGNLSSDGRHINFTSKDFSLAQSFKKCLKLDNKIGRKARGGSQDKIYCVVQFGDKNFYHFLLAIGLMPAKSKVLGKLQIPDAYFVDFLRGCIDGDGNIITVKHPESQHLQLRIRITSASLQFLEWLKSKIYVNIQVDGGWIYSPKSQSVHSLTYGKSDAIKIGRSIYYHDVEHYLHRKFDNIKMFLGE
jgi:hypothetical protein